MLRRLQDLFRWQSKIPPADDNVIYQAADQFRESAKGKIGILSPEYLSQFGALYDMRDSLAELGSIIKGVSVEEADAFFAKKDIFASGRRFKIYSDAPNEKGFHVVAPIFDGEVDLEQWMHVPADQLLIEM